MSNQENLKKAHHLMAEGKYADAISLLQQALKKGEANSSYLYSQIAWAKMKSGKLEEALKEFDTAIELEPANAHYISERAVCKHLMGKNSLALFDLDYALKLEPENPYRYSSRAYVRDCIGDTEGAIQDYLKAIELDPEDSIAHNNLGLLEEKLGRMESAKRRFQKADELEEIKPHEAFTKMPLNIDSKEQSTESAQEKPIEKKQSYFSVIFSVFTTKQGLGEFFDFIKKGLKQ
jgi:tetratricopeptide (TPR) repeat protein